MKLVGRRLIYYVDHLELAPDTIRVENKSHPIVIGPKNWVFSGGPGDAQAAAKRSNLIETAKQKRRRTAPTAAR